MRQLLDVLLLMTNRPHFYWEEMIYYRKNFPWILIGVKGKLYLILQNLKKSSKIGELAINAC
ncbi:hypothetical protein A2774_01235 [Candidatus Roizmanbacteria bacterium RIFCSPHIGHO2_01_FULL_39_12c]|uniref:Uncharacterized protein n=1 Tax=Candidatus Roizmanbacteria bacterium RIFCSPHIGHO2_01_FULL_39_12c TaxID=1802031 RepID=A0A1F7G839_9BACT|nr:MAG: hypothetical protein A2774_01235 [Candidatus Roizmanbacteria bacterium RIFCSPHIGHO2_01_FULL_39_12c]OGK46451.1 MAG: hypothetical protein A2963_01640 [Candidatus Roizmanbacteria bacterium RIFCSPLOWO2_01_FULL_40_13]